MFSSMKSGKARIFLCDFSETFSQQAMSCSQKKFYLRHWQVHSEYTSFANFAFDTNATAVCVNNR